MKKRTEESEILNNVCEYLAYRGYIFWRNNNVAIFDPTRKTFRAMPKYSMRGVSDLICLIDGSAWFIEVKSKKGVQSTAQKEFQKVVEKEKCIYIVVRSIEDLQSKGF